MKGLTSYLMTTVGLDSQPRKLSVHMAMERKVGESLLTNHPDQPRVSHQINDNYCTAPVCNMTDRAQKGLEHYQTLKLNSFVADHVPYVVGHPQKKKKSSPIVKLIKSVKIVSCVDPVSFVQAVTNARAVA